MSVKPEDNISVVINGEVCSGRVHLVHADTGEIEYKTVVPIVRGFVALRHEGVHWARGWDNETRSALRAAYNLSTEDNDWGMARGQFTARAAGGLSIPLGAPVFACPSDPGAVQVLPPKDGNGRTVGKVVLVNADYTLEIKP